MRVKYWTSLVFKGSMDILIRQVEPNDRGEWLRMRLALWPDHSAGEFRLEMEAMLIDPDCAVFVAVRQDGTLGGFLEAAQRKYADGCDTSPVGYIEGWYVDQDLRRQGIGGLLVTAAEGWARQRGLAEMASDSLIDNHISYLAHQRLGYQEMERLVHYCKRL